MKVYIPFNSNDFNSVFTTLSISPCSFYPNRKYSFKRGSTTFINESEDFLIGFVEPIFHNREFDKDFGFPVLVEVDIDKAESELIENEIGFKYVFIDSTIYLFDGFNLIFRSENELNETLAKSLKSIETKYANLARLNSKVIKEDCFVNQLPNLKIPLVNSQINQNTFQKERMLNRVLGSILGSSIAFSNATSKELQEVSILLRFLNNNLSLYLNKIGGDNDFEKKQSLEIISKIFQTCDSIEKLDEAIMLESTMPSDILNSFKTYKIFNVPVYNLIIEGLLTNQRIDLPIALKLEKLTRAINAKYNSKYPNNYIERINNAFNEIKYSIEKQISLSRSDSKLTLDNLIIPELVNDGVIFNISGNLNSTENEYLKQVITYFIQVDNIQDIEYFFINRKNILIDLANHFKDNINGFDTSKEREYLIELLKSFDSLRGGFQISTTNNEVLRSIAILFTSGRDLLRFIENNEKEEIQNPIIYYSLWGAIYGAAIFPKTLTESIAEDKSNLQTILSAFKSSLNNFNSLGMLKSDFKKRESIQDNIKSNHYEEKLIDVDSVNEPTEGNKKPYSKEAIQILEVIELKKKVKLSELKVLFKTFKNLGDIEDLIKNELADRISLEKERTTKFAKLIDSDLFT